MGKVQVEIPIEFLLTVAVWGNMGDGELPDLMCNWAQRLCKENGLSDQLAERRRKKTEALSKRLKNVLGNDLFDKMTGIIDETMGKITG